MTLKATTLTLDMDDVKQLKVNGENVSELCRNAIRLELGSDNEIVKLGIQLDKHRYDLSNYVKRKNGIIKTIETRIKRIETNNLKETEIQMAIETLINERRHNNILHIHPDVSVMKEIAKRLKISWTIIDNEYRNIIKNMN